MVASKGYMLVADLSGYTAYLTSTEFEHANGVMVALLEVLVYRLGAPLRLWRLEGDAVLAYSTDPNFPSGETFLTICEDLYNAFRQRRDDIRANSTCECRACAKVPELDLKLIVHHGQFEELRLGPLRDISGRDAILVHRMPKTRVAHATGIKSYALISHAAFEAMGRPTGLVPYAETLDLFGEVHMHVYDLDAAWNRVRAARTRVRVSEQESLWTQRFYLPVSPPVAWELLVSPRTKRLWMSLISIELTSDTARPGPGARYHCVHAVGEFTGWSVDWEPFAYHSNRYLNAFHPHLSHYETYTLTPTESGTEVCYTMGPMFDPEDPAAGPFPDADAELSAAYKGLLGPMFELLAKTTESDPSTYA